MMMQPHRNFQTITLPATQRKTGKRQWKPSIQVLEEEIILREKTDASQAARAIGFYPPESGRDSNGRPFNIDTLADKVHAFFCSANPFFAFRLEHAVSQPQRIENL
jgi:hypothetical protein